MPERHTCGTAAHPACRALQHDVEADPDYWRNRGLSWLLDRPDIGFADAVRATVKERNAPNFDLPKDAYFDASDIASDKPTRRPHAAPSTPVSEPDDRAHAG